MLLKLLPYPTKSEQENKMLYNKPKIGLTKACITRISFFKKFHFALNVNKKYIQLYCFFQKKQTDFLRAHVRLGKLLKLYL